MGRILESEFERRLVKKLEQMYPGAYVIKNNPNYIQGFPDRLFLFNDFWAAFDAKRSPDAHVRPNQRYYINKLNEMSLAMFVYPENEEEFIYEIQQSLESKRRSRFSKR